MKSQRGGFVLGMIVGLLIGLALALGVALYVTKVPVPFINKVPQRTAEQDAAEAEKNRNWDPNSPLYGKTPAKPSAAASGAVAAPDESAAATNGVLAPPALASSPLPSMAASAARAAKTPASASSRNPADILAGRGNAASGVSTAAEAQAFSYFVQAGAYASADDAEQQRAKLAMLGLVAKVTEREQSGRTMHRVRLGPFDTREEADAAKSRLDGSGVEAALVRVAK